MEYTIPIRQLADEFKITTRTLRFYEYQGLLNPSRDGRVRIFSKNDRTLLNLILRGKRMGFSLAEIRTIINMYNGEAGEEQQLAHLQAKITQQRKSLLQKQKDIIDTLEELNFVEQGCQKRIQELKEGQNV